MGVLLVPLKHFTKYNLEDIIYLAEVNNGCKVNPSVAEKKRLNSSGKNFLTTLRGCRCGKKRPMLLKKSYSWKAADTNFEHLLTKNKFLSQKIKTLENEVKHLRRSQSAKKPRKLYHELRTKRAKCARKASAKCQSPEKLTPRKILKIKEVVAHISDQQYDCFAREVSAMPSLRTLQRTSQRLNILGKNDIVTNTSKRYSKRKLRDVVDECMKDVANTSEKVFLKLSADGTAPGRKCSEGSAIHFTVELVKPLSGKRKVVSLAVLRGKETADNLQTICGELNEEISKINQNGIGITQAFEFFFGADMKMMLLLLGLSEATCTFACMFCDIEKTLRYTGAGNPRSMQDMIKMGQLAKIKKKLPAKALLSQKREPLITAIPLRNWICDEMHLIMRAFDKFWEILNPRMALTQQSDKFRSAIHEILGRHIDSSRDGMLSSTEINCLERQKILYSLADYFPNNKLCVCCRKFVNILAKLKKMKADGKSTQDMANFAKTECADFCHKLVQEISTQQITPYLHIFSFHWYEMVLSTDGHIHDFNQQLVELANISIKQNMCKFQYSVQKVLNRSVRKKLLIEGAMYS